MPGDDQRQRTTAPRSSGASKVRRVPQAWPRDRDFRILSIDGGGIRGLFPASVLAELEQRYLDGRSINACFDLVVGTSTGGIIALGLAAGLTGAELREFYRTRGREIFPPCGVGFWGRARRWLRAKSRLLRYSYESETLETVLREILGDRTLGDARQRLCIPSFEGTHGEVFVFKTPHHPDFTKDVREPLVKVALATAAAPTFFRPHKDNGYTFVDGGIWANNPVMHGLTEALTSFDVGRDRIQILSLGCGGAPYVVKGSKITRGGMLHWADVIEAAMHLQSQNALGQARLLVGPENVLRIDVPDTAPCLSLDDWAASVSVLPPFASEAVDKMGHSVQQKFLLSPAAAPPAMSAARSND